MRGTIMEKTLLIEHNRERQALQKKQKSQWSAPSVPKRSASLQKAYTFYNLPGAFDTTLKKASRFKFINTKIARPSAFGSGTRRI